MVWLKSCVQAFALVSLGSLASLDASAWCSSASDGPCRYPAGDSWCKSKHLAPFAYADKCQSATQSPVIDDPDHYDEVHLAPVAPQTKAPVLAQSPAYTSPSENPQPIVIPDVYSETTINSAGKKESIEDDIRLCIETLEAKGLLYDAQNIWQRCQIAVRDSEKAKLKRQELDKALAEYGRSNQKNTNGLNGVPDYGAMMDADAAGFRDPTAAPAKAPDAIDRDSEASDYVGQQRAQGSISLIPLGLALLALVAMVFSIRRWKPFSRPVFRYWLACSVVWLAGVFGWFLVFGRYSRFEGDEPTFLAIAPPVVAALSLLAWSWARKPVSLRTHHLALPLIPSAPGQHGRDDDCGE